MHLRYDWIPKTYNDYRASPDAWVVTDDFGTRFDALGDRQPGDLLPASYLKRNAALNQELADPDYFHLTLGKPRWHRISEAMAFSTPMGLSIELRLLIDIYIHPHWDEDAGDAYYDRDRSARIEILYMNASLVEDAPQPVTLDHAALHEFCWEYVELERARGAAEARASATEALA